MKRNVGEREMRITLQFFLELELDGRKRDGEFVKGIATRDALYFTFDFTFVLSRPPKHSRAHLCLSH